MDKLGDFDTTYNNYSLFYNNDRNGWRAVLGYNKIDKENIYDKSFLNKVVMAVILDII